ncbi:hypothetical protein GEZ65_22455 [Escherichia albertii]|uniref:hypothetical protein n=1 Tax=Escherichia albertii TaxID=208962 RepID=UPI0003D90E16|nr:hypothetical protein [Escherichia albertii]AHE61738.1 hypothetical protein EAKF1_ch3910 [Escherichia albertii KF1]EFE6909507.1 hypothetical protein [Escherichia albertii]MCZ8724715.1 hypothetical protein [Escherichia albertii]MCZ8737856.1 hypothetical protein [Escherichia albertii]MCZ8803313.1 hypothetical protein [Escherichia albertii]
MKWFISEHVVEAFKKGELTRHQVVMNRNMARSRGYPEREKCFDDALKIIDELRKAEAEKE